MMSANVVRDEWLSVALFFCVIQLGAEAEEKVSFSRDIRPILAENCFQCHGPDENTLEADLRLDRREGAIAELDSGEVAILPGDPEASALIARVAESDEDLRMPPADTGKRLTAKQIELLKQWIANGADYERHWSFAPVRRPELRTVEDDERARNGIDYFVLANLERHGLAPSPEADRYTLIRRVHLDLIGLPPSVDEVDAFVNDKRPGAYERMLDRVLASPRFGERWGRHWLDQARYADSHGYTNDNARTMWPYRDWVTEAFNRDLPFDQFTTEQLAGDLLAEPTLDQLVATGFHRNTLINSEGGTKADQFRDEQVKDRVDTTGVVWLGLTVGCAKCHTHKFDPISQEEYYQFYAFLRPEHLEPGWTRDRIVRAVRAEGVPCGSGICPEIYLEKAFEEVPLRPLRRLPAARKLGKTSLMFPIHPTLAPRDVRDIARAVEKVLRAAAAERPVDLRRAA